MRKTVWIDITNVPHINFIKPIYDRYNNEINFIFSLRDFAETKDLFEKKIGAQYFEVGGHNGSSKINKLYTRYLRNKELAELLPDFDCSLSIGGSAILIAKQRRKPSITFDDNDISPNWLYAPFSNLAFWPKAIDHNTLRKQLFKRKAIYQYDGYKEDFYLADYVPDNKFINNLPFKDYVVVRAENILASYVKGKSTIVPELLKKLNQQGENILFLPRYKFDINYATGISNVFIPEQAISGLDACYFSKAVLTGAGTMAREAACLGVPAISFFAGEKLLAVDKSLIDKGRMFFSRDVDAIISHLNRQKKNTIDYDRMNNVKNEIFDRIDSFFRENKII